MSTPNYCHNCGVAIVEPSAFCDKCGIALSGSAEARRAVGAPGGTGASSPPGGPRWPSPEATVSAASGVSGGSSAEGMPGEVSSGHGGASSAQSGPHAAAHPARTEAPAPLTPEAPPPPGAPASRGWLPFVAVGGGAIVILAMVAALLLALGGSAGTNVKGTSATRTQALQLLAANGTTTVSRSAPGLFAVVRAGGMSALVPAGWRATAQAASGVTRAEFADPKQPSSTLTIVAQKGAGGTDRSHAVAARRSVEKKGDAQSFFGPITFPGGRVAWRLVYSAVGITHSTYFYSACGGSEAMVVDASASNQVFQQEQGAFGAAASSAEPIC